MRRSRGFVFAPWMIYLAIGAAVLAALWLVYTTIDGRGYDRGKSETIADYAKRDNQALQAALDRVKELQDEKAAAELAHEKRLAAIAEDHKKELTNADIQRRRDVDAVHAGYRLRDPGARSTTQCDRGTGSASAAATGQRDGGAPGELSAEATGFLLGFANDADEVARQLGAGQKVILEQIRACNGSP
jgi:hypothetical protein